MLEGEAGIGKTTLWLRAIALAQALSYTVLACRPAESDEQLSFAGRGDLLAGVLDRVLPELPPPQRSALEVALLLADERDRRPAPHAIRGEDRGAGRPRLTNRAAELVIAVHTIEGALTRIYAKLGVRSRTELARRFATAGEPDRKL